MQISGYDEVIPGEVYARTGSVFYKDGKSIGPLVETLLLRKYRVPSRDAVLAAITDAAKAMVPFHSRECPSLQKRWSGERVEQAPITMGRTEVQTAVSGLPYIMLWNTSLGLDKYKQILREKCAAPKGVSKSVRVEYGILPEHIAEELEEAGNPRLYAEVLNSQELKKLGLGRHILHFLKLRCGKFPDREKEEADLKSHRMPNTTLASVLSAWDAVYAGGTLGIADYSGEAFNEFAGATVQKLFETLQEEEKKKQQELAEAASDLRRIAAGKTAGEINAENFEAAVQKHQFEPKELSIPARVWLAFKRYNELKLAVDTYQKGLDEYTARISELIKQNKEGRAQTAGDMNPASLEAAIQRNEEAIADYRKNRAALEALIGPRKQAMPAAEAEVKKLEADMERYKKEMPKIIRKIVDARIRLGDDEDAWEKVAGQRDAIIQDALQRENSDPLYERLFGGCVWYAQAFAEFSPRGRIHDALYAYVMRQELQVLPDSIMGVSLKKRKGKFAFQRKLAKRFGVQLTIKHKDDEELQKLIDSGLKTQPWQNQSPEQKAERKQRLQEEQARMQAELGNDFINLERQRMLDEIKAKNTSYANSLRIRFEE